MYGSYVADVLEHKQVVCSCCFWTLASCALINLLIFIQVERTPLGNSRVLILINKSCGIGSVRRLYSQGASCKKYFPSVKRKFARSIRGVQSRYWSETETIWRPQRGQTWRTCACCILDTVAERMWRETYRKTTDQNKINSTVLYLQLRIYMSSLVTWTSNKRLADGWT